MGHYSQYPMKNHNGKEYEKESTILQYKIKVKFQKLKKKNTSGPGATSVLPSKVDSAGTAKRQVMKFIFENKHSVIHVGNNVDKANPLPAGGDREGERNKPGKPSS